MFLNDCWVSLKSESSISYCLDNSRFSHVSLSGEELPSDLKKQSSGQIEGRFPLHLSLSRTSSMNFLRKTGGHPAGQLCPHCLSCLAPGTRAKGTVSFCGCLFLKVEHLSTCRAGWVTVPPVPALPLWDLQCSQPLTKDQM
jgi:hypothetical protein